MICYRGVVASALLAWAPFAIDATAQPLGRFRWQLLPFCNVVTVEITQNGAVYRLEGTDDQCGNGADGASVTGTAFPNADGTIGFGLNVVTAPGGRPLHVDAEITTGTFSGTWRDSAGATGSFAFTPGAGSGGSPRPLPSSPVPSTILLNPDGAFVAGGVQGAGSIPASGPGTRMMWYPGKAAFRAGRVGTTRWDDANIGQGSVAFGADTTASGLTSTAMGASTTASGDGSTAMGLFTNASGTYSTAIGNTNTASGENALAGGNALGTNAFAAQNGSFVFADRSVFTEFAAPGPNQFFVRAAGGVKFASNAAATLGVELAPNGSQFTSLSDVRTKHRFRELDNDDVLAKIARMPVTEWSYKAQDAVIRHIGPTARGFHAAFGLGEDPRRIGTLDADGVARAGVRALETRTRSLPERAATLETDNASLRAEVEGLRKRV
jgi:hypothetical protein